MQETSILVVRYSAGVDSQNRCSGSLVEVCQIRAETSSTCMKHCLPFALGELHVCAASENEAADPASTELSLPDDVDREFRGKAEKALLRSDIPSLEELGTLPSR